MRQHRLRELRGIITKGSNAASVTTAAGTIPPAGDANRGADADATEPIAAAHPTPTVDPIATETVAADDTTPNTDTNHGGDTIAVARLNEYLSTLERMPNDGNSDNGPGDDSGGKERPSDVAPAARGRKDALTKVLEARDVRDGRSLLEYAAAFGKEGQFMVVVRWLRRKVRMAIT